MISKFALLLTTLFLGAGMTDTADSVFITTQSDSVTKAQSNVDERRSS